MITKEISRLNGVIRDPITSMHVCMSWNILIIILASAYTLKNETVVSIDHFGKHSILYRLWKRAISK